MHAAQIYHSPWVALNQSLIDYFILSTGLSSPLETKKRDLWFHKINEWGVRSVCFPEMKVLNGIFSRGFLV